jgi:hypothetical protein
MTRKQPTRTLCALGVASTFTFTLTLALTLLLGAVQPRVAAAQDGRPSESLDEMMSFFYVERPLDRVDWMLGEITRTRMLDNPAAASPIQGFFAELFASEPERVAGWAKTIATLPTPEQRHLWVAVWFSGNPDGMRAMGKALDANAELKGALATLLELPPPPLGTMRPVSTGDLHFLWGAFFASGKARYIQQISAVLVWDPEELEVSTDLAPMAIYRAVEASLASNAAVHVRVLEVCNLEAQSATAHRKAALERVVARATAVGAP